MTNRSAIESAAWLLDAAGPFAEIYRLSVDPGGVHGLAWDSSGQLLAIAVTCHP